MLEFTLILHNWYNNLAISIKVNLNNPDDYKLSVDEYTSDAFIFDFFLAFLRKSIKNINMNHLKCILVIL